MFNPLSGLFICGGGVWGRVCWQFPHIGCVPYAISRTHTHTHLFIYNAYKRHNKYGLTYEMCEICAKWRKHFLHLSACDLYSCTWTLLHYYYFFMHVYILYCGVGIKPLCTYALMSDAHFLKIFEKHFSPYQ